MGFVGLKILQSTMLIVAAFCAQLLITLSHDFIGVGAPDRADYDPLGNLLQAARLERSPLILAIFYGTSALIFFYFMNQTKLISRFLTVLGFIGAILVLTGAMITFIDPNLILILGLPIGLMEILLGIWLIVKGFNESANDSRSATTDVSLNLLVISKLN